MKKQTFNNLKVGDQVQVKENVPESLPLHELAGAVFVVKGHIVEEPNWVYICPLGENKEICWVSIISLVTRRHWRKVKDNG